MKTVAEPLKSVFIKGGKSPPDRPPWRFTSSFCSPPAAQSGRDRGAGSNSAVETDNKKNYSTKTLNKERKTNTEFPEARRPCL
jgi:hypothetical protein